MFYCLGRCSWGCPRGRRCEFAHGESELRGEAAVKLTYAKNFEAATIDEEKRSEYLGNNYDDGDENLVDVVFKTLKKSKMTDLGGKEELLVSASLANIALKLGDSEQDTSVDDESVPNYFETISGEVNFLQNGKIEVSSGFASVRVQNCFLTEGSHYYEVTMLSGGLCQVK